MKAKEVYAFCKSARGGGFFVIIENDTQNEFLKVLALPDMANDILFYDEFVALEQREFIEKVDTLPGNVFETCRLEYNHNAEILENAVKSFDSKQIKTIID